MSNENFNNINEENKKEDKKKNVIIILLILIILLLLFFIGLLFFRCNSPAINYTPDVGGIGLVVDENAGNYVKPEKTPSKGVAIPGWGTITIPANTTEVMVDFFNPEENKDLYYLTFELRLIDEETGEYETIYTSGLVEPGLHIQKITLSKPLKAGEYNSVIHVQPYRMNEARTATNNADMETKIIVR